MAKRAYAAEDKDARRRVILAAATGLFVAGRGELPGVADIAQAAGLAKGTVYLYFRTKEAIFTALLLDGWAPVLNGIDALFDGGARTQAENVALFLSNLVRHVGSHPELLRLDALGHAVLERNLEPETLRAYKADSHERLIKAGGVLDTGFGLSPGRGVQLLARSYALMRGLWQMFDVDPCAPPAGSMAAGHAGFETELAEALAEYWRGALMASRP